MSDKKPFDVAAAYTALVENPPDTKEVFAGYVSYAASVPLRSGQPGSATSQTQPSLEIPGFVAGYAG